MNPYHIPKLLTMDQVDLKHKRVLIREDLNVPMKDGKVTNDERIQRALPTIKQALAQKAKVMVLSHLGRPQEGDYGAKYSLEPVAEKLALALGQPVMLINEWVNGQFDVNAGEVVLLENVRYEVGENANDHKLAKKMAKLCDVFVMDAFATAHRAQASTAAIIECAPIACAGPLLMEELNALSNALSHPKRPLVAIVGGSKVSTKIQVLKNLLSIVDGLIVGGGIANTFLKAAGYNVGKSLYEADWVEATQELLQLAQTKKVALPLPVDVVVAHECSHAAKAVTKNIAEVTANEMILDIGPHTVAAYKPLLQDAKTIVWNGPVGVFEIPQFGHGTEAIAKIVAVSNAYSIVGGGDTVAAVDQYHLADKISYISTGGGAFLEFLETKPLPAVELLAKRSKEYA